MRLRAARAGAVAGRTGAGAAASEGLRRRKQELQEEIQASRLAYSKAAQEGQGSGGGAAHRGGVAAGARGTGRGPTVHKRHCQRQLSECRAHAPPRRARRPLRRRSGRPLLELPLRAPRHPRRNWPTSFLRRHLQSLFAIPDDEFGHVQPQGVEVPAIADAVFVAPEHRLDLSLEILAAGPSGVDPE